MKLKLKPFFLDSCAVNFAIVLINPQVVPIHVGLLVDDFFIENTVKGTIIRSWEIFFKWAKQYQPGVCIINLLLNNQPVNRNIIYDIFNEYKIQTDNYTCLDSIVNTISVVSNKPLEGVETIFDLIEKLSVYGLIEGYYWLGTEEKNYIQLTPYNRSFVINFIKTQKHA
jgi:hypothetical protein